MIASFNLSRQAYLYAQTLDNQGASEYWSISLDGTGIEPVLSSDPRTVLVRDALDTLQANGRSLPLTTKAITCRVMWDGNCVVTIRPLTRDVHGRVSPVLFLCNILGSRRASIMEAWESIASVTGRQFNKHDRAELTCLASRLQRPRWIVFLYILFFSRRPKND